MIGVLQVVIGLVFVLLLLSLLATTVMEVLSSLLSLRGKNLEAALKNMLASTDADEKIFRAFKHNSLYRQLSERYGSRRRAPSYLEAEDFQSILFDIILDGDRIDKIHERIDSLPDIDLKNVLKQLLTDSEYELNAFKHKVQTWYNNIMDRASGWYKRNIQQIIILVGFLIAVIFNADTIAIYERLDSDPESLQLVVDLAKDYVAQQSAEEQMRASGDIEAQMALIRELVNDEIEQAKSPLGLGWAGVDLVGLTWVEWSFKLLGWLVTALAISLGAPFWFDLLKRLVNIRGAGGRPD